MILSPLLKPWFWHALCCVAALACCVPVLWDDLLPPEWQSMARWYCGCGIMGAFLISVALIAITSMRKLLRLHNLSAVMHALVWGGQWFCAWLIFVAMAYVANVPLPKDVAATSEEDIELRAPGEALTGPESLVIPIEPERFAADKVAPVPNLSLLGNANMQKKKRITLHGDNAHLLDEYISRSPRWSVYTEDDTFYTKPGHVVMLPNVEGAKPGIVHVAFRRVTGGATLPEGYVCVKPGDPMPMRTEGNAPVTDIAIDLECDYYLLLAWRGVSHAETIRRSLNASIATVDSMLHPLATALEQAQPNQESGVMDTLDAMLAGSQSISAENPELLVCEPPTQYGAYQAEVYVNPGEPGRIIMKLMDAKTGTTLRFFNIEAKYSDNPTEFFRHDVPGDAGNISSFGDIPGLLPRKAPLFAVKEGAPHEFFGVAIEVSFRPSSPLKPQRVLIPKRYYRMQACERLTQPEPTPVDSPDNGEQSPRG